MLENIVKRDGRIVPFDQEKITEAIWKAVKAVGGDNREKVVQLSELVVQEIEKEYDGRKPTIEEVQDIVEHTLIEEGHAKTAKAYITYRLSHQQLRDVKAIFDTIEVVDDYIGEKDWAIKENSNMDFSLQGLNNYITQKISAHYWLRRIYPEEIRKAHENADLQIHDLGILAPYCNGWDLEDLLRSGFKGVQGKSESKPAKHLDSILGQITNFFYTLQGESAGAQALSNFDTLLAPFVRKDNLDYDQVKQKMQSFLFNMNVPTRVGFQTPFTNITMDLKVPEYLKDTAVIIGGEMKNETYKEFQGEMDMINQAFAECMLEGDATGKLFSFPIPTYNITKDFHWDNPVYDSVWEMTAKYGIPYFSNFINSDMKPEDARSMCCRLRLDQKELRKRGGGLFGSNPLTGSIGVITINMPRLGFTSVNEKGFFTRLEDLMDMAKDSLETKRKTIERLTEIGDNLSLYPYSKFYLRQVKEKFGNYWQNHFSTIGLLGMNEGIKNFMHGESITTEKGRNFTLKVLDFMREKLSKFQEDTGHIYNLEATPGEGTTYRFAKTDKERFKDIISANEEAVQNGSEPYYTNSTQLPVGHTDDLFEALKLQDEFQIKYTGGTVFHAFVGERLSGECVKLLARKISENFKLPYFTITPTFSICPEDGYIPGEHEHCPSCNQDCDVYSRTVGYIRSVKNWNVGKQAEFPDRKMFKVS